MSLANPAARPGSWVEFFRGLDVQSHVIGALIMREIHTRYGRDNIGYLWVFGEPMTLAISITALHVVLKGTMEDGMQVLPFILGGYCVFIIFRQILGRAEGTLEANTPLLFHRMVTMVDMMVARALLEGGSILSALAIIYFGAFLVGMADPPARPLYFLSAVALQMWFSFGLSLLVAAMAHASATAGRFVHPVIYIMMPLSGCFVPTRWLPIQYRHWFELWPMGQIFEMLRTGMFENFNSPYFHPLYIVVWCMILTVLGMLAVRITRRTVHLN